MVSPPVPTPRVIGPRPFCRGHQRAGPAGPGHIYLVRRSGALSEACMTEVLASQTHSTPATEVHWQGGGGCRVMVWENYHPPLRGQIIEKHHTMHKPRNGAP